jgi:hypothetical protein
MVNFREDLLPTQQEASRAHEHLKEPTKVY